MANEYEDYFENHIPACLNRDMVRFNRDGLIHICNSDINPAVKNIPKNTYPRRLAYSTVCCDCIYRTTKKTDEGTVTVINGDG